MSDKHDERAREIAQAAVEELHDSFQVMHQDNPQMQLERKRRWVGKRVPRVAKHVAQALRDVERETAEGCEKIAGDHWDTNAGS